jgi:N-acyl homoserine lactone hydrolase
MGVAETKIYPINTGWLEADLGTYIFWKGPAGKKIWNPVYCHYVDTGEHKILIDTGLCDEERATRYHHKCDKRGCLQVHEHLEQKLGVHPDEIDAIVFTHLHWDHVQNMKKFRNARYIAPKGEIEMAYNPLPLYYRTYECGILDIEPAYAGCVFEAVEDECEVLPGITMFHTPGHSVGHMAVTVATAMGDIVVAGDAIFQERNLEPNPAEMWRYWVPARFVDSVAGLEIGRGDRQARRLRSALPRQGRQRALRRVPLCRACRCRKRAPGHPRLPVLFRRHARRDGGQGRACDETQIGRGRGLYRRAGSAHARPGLMARRLGNLAAVAPDRYAMAACGSAGGCMMAVRPVPPCRLC